MFFFKGKYDIVADKEDDGNTRFFILGDWGGFQDFPYTTPSEIAVAEAMGQIGKRLNTSFQLALGDNFYYHGVQSVDDPRFKVSFSLLSYQTSSYLVILAYI